MINLDDNADAHKGLSMWVIYEKPRDYPDDFVVRRFVCCAGKAAAMENCETAKTLEGARALIPAGLIKFQRDHRDEPQLVETWL